MTAKIETLAIHGGQHVDKETGAVMPPVYQTSTYAQTEPGVAEWEYSRTHNPTRSALQRSLASLENGKHGLCFSSGMAAIDTVLRTLNPGDKVISGDDVYGGTYRLCTKICARFGLEFTFVNLSDPDVQIPEGTKLVWAETPTNPLLKTTDIAALADKAHAAGALLGVDNTFATPVYQRPLEQGADIVVHSTTKYIGGHSDVVGGAIIVRDDQLAEDLAFIQNSVGATPGPWDSYLTLRGIKTLAIRMQRHTENATAVVAWLRAQPKVLSVVYPGFGGMVAVVLDTDLDGAKRFVKTTKVFTLAESLGGVESLIELPAIMTHASVPPEIRAAIGIPDGLVRLSVGIEHIDDQVADLEAALAVA
jgi:cystathionine gamma-lyase